MNTILVYRGSLDSCNYACGYCPLAKRPATPDALESDRAALERLVCWLERQELDDVGVQFTPWGEALIHPWYQEAMVRLSHRAGLRQVAIQTNLSCDLAWLARCDPSRLGLWCTYHPRQTPRQEFLRQCRTLDGFGVSYSVGMVGLPRFLDEIAALRAALPEHVYLWINAYKSRGNPYSPQDVARLREIDPLFDLGLHPHASKGRPCLCGQRTFSVDAKGDVRRCHFVDEVLGNLYADDPARLRSDRPCPNDECRCHIGYIHMPELRGDELFGDGLLARVPKRFPPDAIRPVTRECVRDKRP